MCRLLHVADVHLDAPLGGFGRDAEARRREVLDAFRRLPETAFEHGADAVLLAGDIFDGPRPSESAVAAAREVVRRLTEESVPVFAVPGNHDARALRPGLYEEALAGATAFPAPRFGRPARCEMEPADLFVYGLAYDVAEEPDPLSTFRRHSADGLHVALLHGAVPGAPHWERGSSLSVPLDRLAELEVDYVALGDLHRFRGPDELDGLPACYPGSFAAVDLTETGLRGPVLVELAPGRPPKIERLSGGVREVAPGIDVDVTDCTSDFEVAEAVMDRADADAYPVVTLRGEPPFALDAEAVRTNLEERFGAVALADESRFFDTGRLEELSRQDTVVGHVARIGLDALDEAGDDEEELRTVEHGLRLAFRVLEV